MPRGKRTSPPAPQGAETYQHANEAVLRPDVGLQPEFSKRKPPRTYRYDSSLDPALSWDENPERELAEWLLSLIEKATELGEKKVFSARQRWKGGQYEVESIHACVQLLRSLSKPFLNWVRIPRYSDH